MEFWESIPFNSEIDSEDIPVGELESDHVDVKKNTVSLKV